MTIILPPPNTPYQQASARVADAERRLLAEMDTQEQGSDTVERHLVYCRVLGCLIYFAPNDSTRSSVALSIAGCRDDAQLVELGASYVQDLFVPLRGTKCRAPDLGGVSRFIFDEDDDEEMDDAARALLEDHHTAKMKALFRDRSRCLVTGHIDLSMAKKDIALRKEVEEESTRYPYYICENTRGVHILPESTGLTDNQTGTSKLWEILEGFGYGSLRKENAAGHHRLQNLLTLEPDVYNLFNGLKLWFEPTERDNIYRIKCYHWTCSNLEREVTFTTPDAINYPLPSRESIKIHAACCQVIHESGVFTYIDEESDEEADCDDDED
ncbi:hypothetical protein EST38_g11750 [Candolleomyces aberdarensis]|uniref:HNH nuclease domain-containing protein n=1 Tax=Candolleomyces aberdarensis TaxID=2316362 RepID=A0A4Q2D435_9AGAR|nr:hypothetical protein EST38_g11750 [Candolleomyces aberdarensis]